jgi:Mor family transcriptional regulator
MNDLKSVFIKRKPERNKKIFALYQEGKTLESIGKRFRLTKERIRVIVNAQVRLLGVDKSTIDKKRKEEYNGLTR